MLQKTFFIFIIVTAIYCDLYQYDVPICNTSPWPMFRRNRLNNGRQTIIENNISNDQQPWSYQTGAGIFSSPVLGCEGQVLVGSADRYFYSLNAENGELNWKFLTNGIIDSAGCVTDQNTVAFPCGDGNLYLLNQSDSSVIWKFESHCMAGSADASQGKHCTIIPAAGGSSNWFEGNVAVTAQGRLYAGADDFRMYGINMETGQEEMNIYAGPIPYGAVWSMITSQLNGNIFFASMTFSVYAFDINGNCLWSKLVGGSISSTPAQSDDGSTIYIGAWNGKLYALNTKNGDTLWEYQTSDLIYSSPAIDENGNIYFSGVDGKIYALNSQGKLLWSYETLYPIDSSVSLLVPRQELYVGGGNARIFCLNYATGQLKWSFITLSSKDANEIMSVNSSPALGFGRVVIGTSSGLIWSVPYEYCENHFTDDWRCETESPITDGEHLLFMSTQGNQYYQNQTQSFKVEKGSIFAFRLLVKNNGNVMNANFVQSKISVSVVSEEDASDVSFDIIIQKGGGSYIFNAIPNGFLPQNFQLNVNAYYQYNNIGQEYEIQRSFNFTTTPSVQLQQPQQQNVDSVPAIIMKNLNLYQPAFYVSINQIGFQSFVMIHSQILQKYGKTLFFSLGGQFSKSQIGYEIDPNTCTIFPALASAQDNDLIIEATDVSIITGGPLMYYDSYRYAGSLQLNENGLYFESRTSSATFKTSCLTIAKVSAMFLFYDLCDSNLNFFTTGSLDSLPYTGTANVKPENIEITSASYSDWLVYKYITVAISTTSGSYLRSEHIISVIMYNIDDDAQSIELVEMDYYKNLKISTDSEGNINKVTLDIPLTVSITKGKTHFVVMTDLYPFHDQLIS